MSSKNYSRSKKSCIRNINLMIRNFKFQLRDEWVKFSSFNLGTFEILETLLPTIEEVKKKCDVKDSDLKRKPLVIKVKYEHDYDPNVAYKPLVDNNFVKFCY